MEKLTLLCLGVVLAPLAGAVLSGSSSRGTTTTLRPCRACHWASRSEAILIAKRLEAQSVGEVRKKAALKALASTATSAPVKHIAQDADTLTACVGIAKTSGVLWNTLFTHPLTTRQ